jgi:hypothetical protein
MHRNNLNTVRNLLQEILLLIDQANLNNVGAGSNRLNKMSGMSGEEFKLVRELLDLKQIDYGEKLGGLSARHVYRLENGKVPVSKRLALQAMKLVEQAGKKEELQMILNKSIDSEAA